VVKKKTPSRRKPVRTTRSSTARKHRTSSKRKQAAKRDNTGGKGFLFSRKIWTWLGSFGLTMVILGLLVLVWLASELPDLDKLESYDKPPGIRVYDTAKNMIGSYGHVVGKYVAYDEIPKHVKDALLATEDRRFFEHSGVDPWGIMRAMVRNISAGGVVQGGSTITQQLAKNTFLTPERTLKRKIQEVMLSFWIEGHFSKEKIIEIYLNRVYLGAGNYGIDAAAYHYFDKSASELTLQESALLVGLLKAPSRYAPTRDKELSFKRTKQVILNMKDAELLNDRAASEAIGLFEQTINFKPEEANGGRYFADWVVDLIPQHLGQVDGDLEVYTTLDPSLQLAAEETVARYIEKEGKEKDATQATILTMTPDGAVKAMVGGANYVKSQFNRVTQAKRQPGSAFKLFVYLAALESGISPNSWVVDRPVKYGNWSPKNYNGRYLGDLRLREAFFRSVNTVAVKLTKQVGVGSVIKMAKRLGITEPLEPNLSLSLGTSEITMLEMVGAYAHLANDGRKMKPYAIRKIVRQKDNEVVYERTGEKQEEGVALRGNITRMMNDLMSDTISFGTGRRANFGRPAAGKTGTSQNSRDAWFIGYTPQYVTGAWVGNDDNSPTKKITGGSMPARMWRDVMKAAHKGKPVMTIPQHFQYFDGDAMIGDIYTATGEGLPWRPNAGAAQPTVDLPWNNNRRNKRDRLRFDYETNPRHQIHNGAPVERDMQLDLPTSRTLPKPVPTKPQEQKKEEFSPSDWVKEKANEASQKREYDYPQGGRKRRRMFQ